MLLTILQGIYVAFVVFLLFNLTIFFHELGHYLVGRWRGAKIERFAIWFGGAIWKKTFQGVEFRLGWIPLGGYVALPQLGMEVVEGKSETPKEEIKPLRPRDKIPILLAGSFANVLFAIVVATLVWAVGLPRDAAYFDLKIGYVEPGSLEYEAGIRSEDRIKSINGKPVDDWEEVVQAVALSLSEKVRVGLERTGKPVEFELTPARDNLLKIRRLNLEHASTPVAAGIEEGSPAARAGIRMGDEFLELNGEKLLGTGHLIERIRALGGKSTRLLLLREGKRMEIDVIPAVEKDSTVARIGVRLDAKTDGRRITAHPSPWKQITKSLLLMADTLNALLHPRQTGVGVGDLSGPLGIGWILWMKTLQDIRETLYFIVILNINLAIINLLPIPLLDGGHICFTLIEAIRRKPFNQKFIEATQTLFAALLITLMLYITFKDAKRMKDFGVFGKKGAPAEPAAPPAPEEKQKGGKTP